MLYVVCCMQYVVCIMLYAVCHKLDVIFLVYPTVDCVDLSVLCCPQQGFNICCLDGGTHRVDVLAPFVWSLCR